MELKSQESGAVLLKTLELHKNTKGIPIFTLMKVFNQLQDDEGIILYNFHHLGENISSHEFWNDVTRLESINLIERISPSIHVRITEKGKKWANNINLDEDLEDVPIKINDALTNTS